MVEEVGHLRGEGRSGHGRLLAWPKVVAEDASRRVTKRGADRFVEELGIQLAEEIEEILQAIVAGAVVDERLGLLGELHAEFLVAPGEHARVGRAGGEHNEISDEVGAGDEELKDGQGGLGDRVVQQARVPGLLELPRSLEVARAKHALSLGGLYHLCILHHCLEGLEEFLVSVLGCSHNGGLGLRGNEEWLVRPKDAEDERLVVVPRGELDVRVGEQLLVLDPFNGEDKGQELVDALLTQGADEGFEGDPWAVRTVEEFTAGPAEADRGRERGETKYLALELRE